MVMGDDSCSRDCGFESQRRILDGHFFALICCKNCIVCVKSSKINEKEAEVGPFKKIRLTFQCFKRFESISSNNGLKI